MTDLPRKPPTVRNADNVTNFPVPWREIRLPRWASSRDEFLSIEILDNSLESEHILKGDFAIVHLTDAIHPGDAVAVFTRHGDVITHFDNDMPEGAIRGKVIRIERDL